MLGPCDHNSTFTLSTIDGSTGATNPVNGSYLAQYTQGGLGAAISQYDRCNVFFCRMIEARGSDSSSWLVGVDMTSGQQVLSVAEVDGWSLAYYRP